ncbi:MAG: LysR family transcriptional regulator [Hyphomonadaceae bacterium]|nr:LysR family transcriptional regulator [Hyphomonadaceae bacterium]
MRDAPDPSRLIELRHLRYFLALADARSFTLAAERLNVTQPTLSHQIKQLEMAIGAVLFERRSKDVELSQAGSLFRPYCERMLKELELGALALSELEGLMRGTLRMAVSHSFSSSMLPNALSEFASRYPGVRVVARVIPRLEMERALVAGELDLAIAYVSDDSEHIAVETLTEETLVLIVGPDHPWAGRRSVPMGALAEIPLVLLTPEFAARQFVDNHFRQARLAANIVLEMNAIEPILAIVRSSRFAAVLSNGAISSAKGVHLIDLHDPVPRRMVAILWRRHGQRSAAAERMAAMIRTTYGVTGKVGTSP